MSTLVTRPAPDFTAPAVLANGEIQPKYNFRQETAKKPVVLLFYPLDFTFVCPSELIAFDHAYKELTQRGAELIGISIDSQFTHAAWRKTPINQGGIGPIQFPLIADVTHTICRSYGVEHPEAGVALRGLFIIDDKGIIRSQIVNDLPLGRNVDEVLRLIDAIQFTEKHGEVCPANWRKGKSGMVASAEGVAKYLGENSDQL